MLDPSLFGREVEALQRGSSNIAGGTEAAEKAKPEGWYALGIIRGIAGPFLLVETPEGELLNVMVRDTFRGASWADRVRLKQPQQKTAKKKAKK